MHASAKRIATKRMLANTLIATIKAATGANTFVPARGEEKPRLHYCRLLVYIRAGASIKKHKRAPPPILQAISHKAQCISITIAPYSSKCKCKRSA